MNTIKILKDKFVKTVAPDYTPVRELHTYLKDHGGIHFEKHQLEDGSWISRSTNFIYGSILTTGRDLGDLDVNTKDAILTAFEIPSSYAMEANIHQEGEEYALA